MITFNSSLIIADSKTGSIVACHLFKIFEFESGEETSILKGFV